jgi:hypothetical protein
MAVTIETTFVKGGKTYKRTTTADKPGDAYVYDKKRNVWKQPPQPKDGQKYIWNDNQGWVTSSQVAANFGFTRRLILTDDSLQNLFNQAWNAERTGQEWSKEKFLTALKSTDWFKGKNEAARKFAVLQATDREEFNSQTRARRAVVGDIAGQMGVNFSEQELNAFASDSLRLGYTDAEIKNMLSQKIDPIADEKSGQHYTGEAGDNRSILTEWADANGVSLDGDWFKKQVTAIAAGDITIGNSKDFITRIAKKTYGAHADNITSKDSARDAGAHYQQIISQMLGVPSGEVTMKNPWMQKLMSGKEENGQELTIDSAEKMIRSSDEWANGKPGTEEINDFTNKLLSQFGMV